MCCRRAYREEVDPFLAPGDDITTLDEIDVVRETLWLVTHSFSFKISKLNVHEFTIGDLVSCWDGFC